jgi:DNA-binding YbaB/EbfC family protein
MANEFDLNAMMQQAQAMQEQMLKAQEEARGKTVEASAGGGMVTVTMTGGLEVRKIKIDPAAVDPKDVAMLEDLIAAAINQAVQKAQQLSSESMQAAMGPFGGMLPPGLL